jgi:LCP family protein required for cell wall assembly
MNNEDLNIGPVEWGFALTAEDRVKDLRRYLDQHQYVEVVKGCEEVLELYPKNRAAKRLLKKAKRRLVNHEIKLSMAVMGMLMMVVVGSMSFMSDKIVGELKTKDFQVNSLITEMGELREENLLLYRKLETNFQSISTVTTSVTDLEKLVPEDGFNLMTLKEKLESAESKLAVQSEAVEKLVNAGIDREPVAKIAKGDTLDILILGTHGRLTDTIMLASLNPQNRTVSLFSIPRDLAVNGRRINEFYYRYGIDPLRDQIEEITGLYPEKYVVVDLSAFEEIVDAMGGIDVDVPRALHDTMYPAPGFRYQTFSVAAGKQHFDGNKALKYARSRKTTSDFDRAERQQLIIEAVRNKIQNLDLIENMEDLVGMYSSIMDSIDTDVDMFDFVSYAKRYHDYEFERGNVLTSGNYLYSTTSPQGAYLLLPRDGTYQAIHDMVADVVTN